MGVSLVGGAPTPVYSYLSGTVVGIGGYISTRTLPNDSPAAINVDLGPGRKASSCFILHRPQLGQRQRRVLSQGFTWFPGVHNGARDSLEMKTWHWGTKWPAVNLCAKECHRFVSVWLPAERSFLAFFLESKRPLALAFQACLGFLNKKYITQERTLLKISPNQI